MSPFFKRLGCSCVLAAVCSGAFACDAVEFELNDPNDSNGIPQLAWRPVTGAVSYSVNLIARVPEGPVVDVLSVHTAETRVNAPKLDPARSTAIKLSVTAVCPDGVATSSEMTWLIPVPTRCAPIVGATVREGMLRWPRGLGSEAEIRVFDAISAGLVASMRSAAPGPVSIVARGPVVIALRPICGAVFGPSSYLMAD